MMSFMVFAVSNQTLTVLRGSRRRTNRLRAPQIATYQPLKHVAGKKWAMDD